MSLLIRRKFIMNNGTTLTNVSVHSNTFTGSALDIMQQKVFRMLNEGYSKMAIMYFLGQNYSVSGMIEDGTFIINVN